MRHAQVDALCYPKKVSAHAFVAVFFSSAEFVQPKMIAIKIQVVKARYRGILAWDDLGSVL